MCEWVIRREEAERDRFGTTATAYGQYVLRSAKSTIDRERQCIEMYKREMEGAA